MSAGANTLKVVAHDDAGSYEATRTFNIAVVRSGSRRVEGVADSSQVSKRSTSTAAPLNIVWLIFFGLMVFSPETLTAVWEWVQGRNDALQVILWILTLPYMVALAIWESDWQTWLRIVLVVSIALIFTGITNPSYSGNRPG